MCAHDCHYFVDSGGYSGFDMDEWIAALERATRELPRWPDFIVWPDVFGDALATRELCESLFNRDAPLIARRQDLARYVVFQPGLPLDDLFKWARSMGADGVFLGGPDRWQRTHGPEIVRRAHEHDWPVHLGNAGGEDGLVWAYRTGFDSADTTSIMQNGYWHYLDALERATDPEDGGVRNRAHEAGAQSAVTDW